MTEKLPLKAPNTEWDIETLQYPVLVSYKLDGIRCIYKRSEILSASMKPIPNVRLKEKFKNLKIKEYVIDGELYSHDHHFTDHVSTFMSKDKPIPDGFKFYVFDVISLQEWNSGEYVSPYLKRYLDVCTFFEKDDFFVPHKHCNVNTRAQLQSKIDSAESKGYEGIMIRNPDALYKNGRATTKQNIIHKHKFWEDYDAKIVAVNELYGNLKDIEREYDETGHIKSVHSISLKEPKNTFGSFTCRIDDNPEKEINIGSWQGLTDELRDQIWRSPDQYINRWVRFKSMSVGEKHLPRIPKDLEFRDDKTEESIPDRKD